MRIMWDVKKWWTANWMHLYMCSEIVVIEWRDKSYEKEMV